VSDPAVPAEQPAAPERPRGVPYARIFTTRAAPVLPSELADALTDRGFVPGFTDPEGAGAPLSEAGLGEARFTPGEPGFRVISLSSSRGFGCQIAVEEATAADLPDDPVARRAVPRPRLVYVLEGGGPGNSDRNLCENLAEALMLMTNGVVWIGGLGVKGNRPVVHATSWLGTIKRQ
jgi:hypothetical protein